MDEWSSALHSTAQCLSPLSRFDNRQLGACEKAAKDMVLGGGFRRVLQ